MEKINLGFNPDDVTGFNEVGDFKPPYGVPLKRTPIVDENGDVVGSSYPCRASVGDDTSQMDLFQTIGLSDPKNASAVAAQLALVANQETSVRTVNGMDAMQIADSVRESLNNSK